MKNLIFLFSTLAGTALLATNAIAEDNSATANVFKADMSNPDLAAAITSFQEVCLPFIMHTTELTQSLNMQHHKKMLAQQGYVFHDRTSLNVVVTDRPWGRVPQSIHQTNPIGEHQINRTGEIWGPALTPQFTAPFYTDSFVREDDPRRTVLLSWNYLVQKTPAWKCQVKMENHSISKADFETDFIANDPDWKSYRGEAWIQPPPDEEHPYGFKVEHKDDYLSLVVWTPGFYFSKPPEQAD